MENELIIEVTGDNEFYRTRDGRKARIYALDGGGGYPVHGSILNGNTWLQCSWDKSGKLYFSSEEAGDIIGKWQEPLDFDWEHCCPPWMNWIARNNDGRWVMFTDKPTVDGARWNIPGDFLATDDFLPIPSSYAPKNYNGTWQDSLRERPKV